MDTMCEQKHQECMLHRHAITWVLAFDSIGLYGFSTPRRSTVVVACVMWHLLAGATVQKVVCRELLVP